AEKQVVLLALDNPFTDPVAEGFLQGKAPPPAGAPEGLPFAIHHTNLAESGIYQIQNANLGALAQDKVWHHHPATASAGKCRVAGKAGGDRRARTIVAWPLAARAQQIERIRRIISRPSSSVSRPA